MALDYNLQQTGPEVQERLDEVPVTRADLNQEIADREAADTTLQQNINAEAQARETAEAALQDNIDAEGTRAAVAEQTNADAIAAEVTRAQNKEAELADSVNQEKQARINVAATLQDNINAEATRAQTAEQANASALEALQTLIPASASAQNKLADKEFVNSSIATATATFRGTYNLITDLNLTIAATHTAIAIKLGTAVLERDKNDYVFVQIPVSAPAPTEIAKIERYKFDGSVFMYEYELNNSSFTTEQWNALNSGITSGLVEKLQALPTNSDLNTLLDGKQDTINDLQEIREGAAAGASSYQLPGTGIPATDLSEDVQESLEAADNAAPDVFGPYANVAAAHAALSAKGLNTIGRTVGIVSPSNMVVEYWYQGGTAQVNLVLKQSEVEQVKSINNIPISGTGNIEVVQADFEDLANDKGTLKLADKAYVPNDFSGMGRVYLRKNMINASLHFADIISDLPSTETETLFGSCDEIVYETTNSRFLAVKNTSEGKKYYPNYQFTGSEVYSNPDDKHIYVCDTNAKLYTYENDALEETTTLMDKNVLTQDMINKPNTIYIIQYDYDIVDLEETTTTNNLTINGEYYSYKPITIEDNQTYRALNDCVFIDYRHNSLIGSVLVTGENESQDFAIAKKSSAASGVPVSYYSPNGTINVPANCVLQFEGGTLNNGTVNLNSTTINPDYNYLERCTNLTTTGSVSKETYKADEEDITNDNGELKLKDKVYSPNNYSGLGRKYLRKNIVNGINTLTRSVLNDTNILTQSMLNQANTIYVIQYDFTLSENITIPANCILKFDGGSISGEYTLTGNNTQIKADKIAIFSNILIDGTWNVPCINSEWFADANEEDRILQVFNLCSNDIHNLVHVDNRTFIVTAKSLDATFPYQGKGIELNKKDTDIIIDGTIRMKNNSSENYSVFLISADNISIYNGNIVGDKDGHVYPPDSGTHEWGMGILVFNVSNFNVNGTNVSKCTGDGIYFNRCTNSKITNINISNCRRQGISITDDCHNIIIDNFRIYDISGTDPQSGIDIEPNSTPSSNITIRNGVIHNTKKGLNIFVSNTIEELGGVKNVLIDNVLTENTNTYSVAFIGKAKNIQLTNCIFDAKCSFANYINVVLCNCIIDDDTKVMLFMTAKAKLTIYNSIIISADSNDSLLNSSVVAYNSTIKLPLSSSNMLYKFIECDIEIENGSWKSVYGNYIRCNITNPNDTAIQFLGENIISSTIVLADPTISAAAIALNSERFRLEDVLFSATENVTVSNLINCGDGAKIGSYIIDIRTDKITYQSFSRTLDNKGIVIKNETPRVNDTAFSYQNNNLFIGASKFDGTKPLWWNGTTWVDATGTPV